MSGTSFYVRHKHSSLHPFLMSTPLPPNDGLEVKSVSDLDENHQVEQTDGWILEAAAPSRFRFLVELDEDEYPVTDEWSLVDIATKYPPLGWEPLFLRSVVELEHKDKQLKVWDYLPEKRNIFRAFEECPFQKLKVVLMGQDPYATINKKTGLPDAVGLSFSSRREHAVPPSLQAIYKEIRNTIGDVGEFKHPDLTRWARQGVLLLNSALTVEKGQPKSHANQWTGFINSVLRFIKNNKKNCVFVALGRPAEATIAGAGFSVDNKRVLPAGHPSPLNRGRNTNFFNTGIFSLVNQQLREDGETPIDWNID